jgi:hypothetical protein
MSTNRQILEQVLEDGKRYAKSLRLADLLLRLTAVLGAIDLIGILIRKPLPMWCLIVQVNLITICQIFLHWLQMARLKHQRAGIYAYARERLGEVAPYKLWHGLLGASVQSLASIAVTVGLCFFIGDQAELFVLVLFVCFGQGAFGILQTKLYIKENGRLLECSERGELGE